MSSFNVPADDRLDDEIERNVTRALAEDVGPGDLTAQLVPASQHARATVIAREESILCGAAWFTRSFTALDPSVYVGWNTYDGQVIKPGEVLCTVEGPARALLTGERTALNFLQLLSGVAGKTRRFADAVAGTRSRVVDTRKSLPGLRLAQKYAVACGGGDNHRLGLYDAILIKENHILAAGGIAQALDSARRIAAQTGGRCTFIEIEVETLVFVFGLTVSLFLEEVEEAQAFDLQVFVKQKRNPVAPSHGEARYNFTVGNMLANFFAFERVLHVAHGGLFCRTQFEILIECKVARRFALSDPSGHCRRRRLGYLQKLGGQLVNRLAQVFKELFRLCRGGGVNGQPAVNRVDPAKGRAATDKCSWQQFDGHGLAQIPHFLAPNAAPLVFLDFLRFVVGELFDDGSR